jgi:hypothetical protein
MVDKLNPSKYQQQEKQFMAFGSICNMCQRIITPENKKEIIDWAWAEAREKTKNLMNTLYEEKTEIEKTEPVLPTIEI